MARVKLPSGREVDQATYERFTAPLHATVVAGPRKSQIIFALDALGQPWGWGETLEVLADRLRKQDAGLLRRIEQQYAEGESDDSAT